MENEMLHFSWRELGFMVTFFALLGPALIYIGRLVNRIDAIEKRLMELLNKLEKLEEVITRLQIEYPPIERVK